MKETVLIVDDNPTNLQLASVVLSPFYKLLLAENGEMAIRTAEQRIPDLILLDIMMPGFSGYDVCRALKANPLTKVIPVIFLTAKAQEQDIQMAYEVGGVDYITKPFKEKEVLARIKTQLELRNARTELEEQNDKLRDLVANRDRFFSIIAHDLRSPFSALLGVTQMMAEDFESFTKDEIVRNLNSMSGTVGSLYELMDNLLKWANIQRDRIMYMPLKINLLNVINSCLAVLNTKAEQKAIKFIINIDPNLNLLADENMVDTILRNLLTNALKFSYRGGTITVTAAISQDDCVHVAVVDEGIGLGGIDKEKLFSINEKVNRRGTENEPSAGIGLLLCKEFAEKMGGRLWAENNEPAGSRFNFTLNTWTDEKG